MTRGIGELEVVAGLPDAVVDLAAVVTQLGSQWSLLAGIALAYVLSRRGDRLTETPGRDCLYLVALAIGAHALAIGLKASFALPRPPGAMPTLPSTLLRPLGLGPLAALVTVEAYGFPSGHALQATVVYSAAARLFLDWNRDHRLLGVGLVVGLIAASRVVLGVHYLVDVVGGVVAGVLYLAVVARVSDRDPRSALLVAMGVGLVALALSSDVRGGLIAAAAVIGLLLWRWRRPDR